MSTAAAGATGLPGVVAAPDGAALAAAFDLKRLDPMVDSLKARGLTKANRSALIRYALGAVNLETVPKGL